MLLTSSNSLIRCSISTERVDFLEPNVGRTATGGFRAVSDVTFSLLSADSSAPDLTTGDAGIVLRRFFSATAPVVTDLEEDEAASRGLAGVVTDERELVGTVAGFLASIGLVVPWRAVVVEGWTVVRRAGEAATDFVVEVDGASDILLGFAEMPSLPFSSPEGFPSTVLSEPRVLWVTTEGVAFVVAGLRTVDAVVLGRAGGLLSEPPTADFVAVDVVDGRAAVDIRGVADLVTGLAAGDVFAFGVVVSSFVSMLMCEGCI